MTDPSIFTSVIAKKSIEEDIPYLSNILGAHEIHLLHKFYCMVIMRESWQT